MGLIKSKASACDEKSRDKTDGWGQGKTAASELARSHDLTVAEVEQWLEDLVSMGTEALRSHPRDAEARHKAEKKELLAKIGELTMEKEVWMIARDMLGKPLPDANS
jgi:hypothetical protein